LDSKQHKCSLCFSIRCHKNQLEVARDFACLTQRWRWKEAEGQRKWIKNRTTKESLEDIFLLIATKTKPNERKINFQSSSNDGNFFSSDKDIKHFNFLMGNNREADEREGFNFEHEDQEKLTEAEGL
jgi:hypothetical protein